MTAARIRVYNHILDSIDLDYDAFAEQIERLKQRLARRNPMAVPVRRTIDGAIEPLKTAPDREALLHGLLNQDLSTVARTTLLHLAGALPPLAGRIVCHLVPNGGNRGSGTGWGKDRLLATVPCKGDAAYETGGRIIRSYLDRHGISIVEAHRLPSTELYSGSGYPFLR